VKSPRTTDSSLPILFISRSPPSLLDTLKKPLSYPVPAALPFLLDAFALQLIRRLCALKRVPFFHLQLREQR
jgi:hypothetical protein